MATTTGLFKIGTGEYSLRHKDIGDGKQVLNIKCSEQVWTGKEKQYVNYEFTAWGRNAGYLNEKLELGQFVHLSGKCKGTSEYKKSDGTTGTTRNYELTDFSLIYDQPESGGNQNVQSQQAQVVDEDEIPF